MTRLKRSLKKYTPGLCGKSRTFGITSGFSATIPHYATRGKGCRQCLLACATRWAVLLWREFEVRMKQLLPLILLRLLILPVRAEDWTTTDGKTYRNVKVLKVEPDVVTIMHKDGGGAVNLAT